LENIKYIHFNLGTAQLVLKAIGLLENAGAKVDG